MHFAVIASLLLAASVLLLGLAVSIRPQVFTGLAKYFVEPWGIWVAAGIRLFAAVVLWYAAPASRFPGLFKVFAVVLLIAAVGVLLVGHRRIQALVGWAIGRPASVIRLFAALAIAAGGFVVWALLV